MFSEFLPKHRKTYKREVPLRTLFKGTAIITVAPLMLLIIYAFFLKALSVVMALYGAVFIFTISIIFVYPYIANLSALTHYVRELSLDRRAEAPDLSFLNNVEELSEAVEQLHNTWERKRNQLESMVSESKILIDSLPDVLIMLDKDKAIIRTNSTAKAVFSRYDYKKTLQKIVDEPQILRAVEAVMEDRHGRSLPFFLAEPFSHYYIVRIEPFPTYSPGSIAVIIAMHNITEQKRTEQMLSDFVANASHEIRTPLTSMMGFIETLQTSAKNDPKAQEEFLLIMQQQANRMAKLIKDLLSLSQIERNLHTLPTEKVIIADMLKEVKRQQQAAAKEKKMPIRISSDSDKLSVRGDPDELMMLFDNLINNAIKYGKNNTPIEVHVVQKEAARTEGTWPAGTEHLVAISVTDQGEGIASEHIHRLTERFYRVDTARSRKVGGSGLGLAIVKHIVDRHQGTISIESEENVGSTFTVTLPSFPQKKPENSGRG